MKGFRFQPSEDDVEILKIALVFIKQFPHFRHAGRVAVELYYREGPPAFWDHIRYIRSVSLRTDEYPPGIDTGSDLASIVFADSIDGALTFQSQPDPADPDDVENIIFLCDHLLKTSNPEKSMVTDTAFDAESHVKQPLGPSRQTFSPAIRDPRLMSSRMYPGSPSGAMFSSNFNPMSSSSPE